MSLSSSRTRALATSAGGTVVLLLCLVASLSLNTWLALRSSPAPSQSRQAGLQEGVVLPAVLAVKSIDGQATQVPLRGSVPVLLYVMSPTCGWCARNYDNIVALARHEQIAGKYRLVGLSNHQDAALLRDHLKSYPLPFEVFIIESGDDVSKFYLDVTPQTATVGPDGIVTNAWVGAYTERLRGNIETAFGLTLPGLRPIPTGN